MSEARTETYSVIIERNPETNELVSETWLDPETGEEHRRDGPAFTWRYPSPDGQGRPWCCREYKLQGKYHRGDDLPACVVTDELSGIDVLKIWYDHDRISREGDKPAYVKVDPITGVTVEEEYRLSGEYHRESGFARIAYDRESGEIRGGSTYRHGVKILGDGQGPPEPR